MESPRAQQSKVKRNRKYKLNERCIQKAILKLLIAHRGRITTNQVIKETKLSKRTIYTHYPIIGNAPDEIEKQILYEFISEIDNEIQTLVKIIQNSNERIFYAIFVFITKRKDVFFQICTSVINQGVLYKMMEIVYPRLKITWYPNTAEQPVIGNDRADMFTSMEVEIIRKWGVQTHCNLRKSSRYIRRLMRLTSEASARCK